MEENDLINSYIYNPKNSLISSDIIKTDAGSRYDALFEQTTSLTGNTGLGKSKFDYNVPFSQLDNLGEIRAQRQPWVNKAGAGLARIGVKALTEVAKMPGVLGGIVGGAIGQASDALSGEDNTDFIKTAFDNTWIKSLNNINETINTELLPVYVKKSVAEGNLWDNISSIDFWAKEGADGIGYIVSMLVPGAIINKFNIGAKIAGINKFAKMGDRMDEAVSVIGKLKMSPQTANLTTATLANTLFEAGAEAQGAMESFKVDLDNKLASGEINQDEYNISIQRQSEVGRNVFIANTAILIGPNAMMSKMLWGKARNKALNLVTKEGNTEFAELAKRTLKQKVARGAGVLAKGAASEGFWEEGMQSVAETYFSKEKGDFGDFIGDLPSAYADMIATTEGQKAIFLGAAFGGGMTLFHDYKQGKNEVDATNKIIKVANKSLNDFYTVFKGDNFKENPDANDLDTFVKKLRGFQGLETISDIYDFAKETGNTTLIESLRDMAVVNLVKPFIVNDKLGIAALQQHLESSKELIELSDSSWEGSTDDFIKHIIGTATKLQEVYKNYNDFAPTTLDLKVKEATEKDKSDFYNELADNYVNAKATEFHTETELNKQKEARNKLLAERGRTQGELETNPMLHRELATTDLRFKKVDESITELNNQLIEAKKEVDKLWNEKELTKRFSDSLKNKALIVEEDKKKSEIDDVITKIKNARTDKEVDDIVIPESIASTELSKRKERRKKELKVEKDLKDSDKKTNNKKFDQEKKIKALQNEEALNYVQDNYNVGEKVTIEPEFGLDAKYNDLTATIKSITENGVEFEFEDGTTVIASIEDSKKVIYSNNANFSSEGGENNNTQETVVDTTSGEKHERRGDSRIMSSDNKGGVLFGNTAALEFEQVPRDKVGEEKGIEVPTDKDDVLSANQLAALTMFKAKDFSNIDFLIDHLPLSVKLSEGVTAPLATKSEKSEEYNKVFNETTRHLRETIIKEIANNNVVISNITVPIAGQWNGELQVTETKDGLAVENPIAALYEFSGDMSKIQSSDFYMVDDFGFLKNNEGVTFPTTKNKSNAKGEIYLLINMANGKKFPLKLNVAKITTTQADILFDMYKFLSTDNQKNREVRIEDLTNTELKDKIKEVFAKEIELFSKNKKSIKRLTVGDIIDTVVFSSSSPKTQLRFVGNNLYLTDKIYTPEDLDKPGIKEQFINIVSNTKRQQIRFKKRRDDTENSFNFENRSYIDYLLSNDILNTNAVINTPTFAGRTSIYLDTKGVKIDGVESMFNQEVPVYLSESLLGTNDKLKVALPGLFTNPVKLNTEGTHYVSTKDPKKKYSRVSTLKGGQINPDEINVYNAAKRGDVVDELIRQFFSNPYFKKSDFIKRGVIQVIDINKKKPNTQIMISDEFFGQLFNILETYKAEFDKRNWTVYSNSPALSGTIGTELFAGTGDLLVYDNNKKDWIFIDVKTSSKNRSEYYEGKDPYGYKSKDAIQQNAYRELFKQSTGIEVKHLLILPLTVTSEDPGVNSEYRKISIGLTNNDKKLLVVDMSKDVYALTDRKKKTESKPVAKPTIKRVETEQFDMGIPDNFVSEFHPDDVPQNLLDLSQFGIEIAKPKPKPVVTKPVQTSPTSTTGAYKITKEQYLEAKTALKGYSFEAVYGGKIYIVTGGSYWVFNNKGQMVTKLSDILNIITAFNKTIPEGSRIDKEIVKKIWNSRINVVPLQEATVKQVTPTQKTNNVDANTAVTKLSNLISKHRKDNKATARLKGEDSLFFLEFVLDDINKRGGENSWVDLNDIDIATNYINIIRAGGKVENKVISAPTVKTIVTKQVDTMNFDKLTTAKAEEIIMTLMEKVPSKIKDIAKILETNKSSQEKVKSLYSMLENNAIGKNIIETKCKK